MVVSITCWWRSITVRCWFLRGSCRCNWLWSLICTFGSIIMRLLPRCRFLCISRWLPRRRFHCTSRWLARCSFLCITRWLVRRRCGSGNGVGRNISFFVVWWLKDTSVFLLEIGQSTCSHGLCLRWLCHYLTQQHCFPVRGCQCTCFHGLCLWLHCHYIIWYHRDGIISAFPRQFRNFLLLSLVFNVLLIFLVPPAAKTGHRGESSSLSSSKNGSITRNVPAK